MQRAQIFHKLIMLYIYSNYLAYHEMQFEPVTKTGVPQAALRPDTCILDYAHLELGQNQNQSFSHGHIPSR